MVFYINFINYQRNFGGDEMSDNNKALSKNMKDFDFKSIHNSINENSKVLDNLVDELVSTYCKELDTYVK